MLKQLENVYKEYLTHHYKPNDENWIWFETMQQQIFGIHKSRLSNEEINFLKKIFNEFVPKNFSNFTIEQEKWYSFLFKNGNCPSSKMFIQLFYVYIDHELEQLAELVEAISGILGQPIVIPISKNHVLIIDQFDINMVRDISLTDMESMLEGDFAVKLKIFRGQVHTNNHECKQKFEQEYSIIKKLTHLPIRLESMPFYQCYLLVLAYESKVDTDYLSTSLINVLQDTELVHTLRIFFESNLNVSVAAKKLYIHRNSLQYRIDKLNELTGLDIRQFQHAAFLYMLLLKMQAEG